MRALPLWVASTMSNEWWDDSDSEDEQSAQERLDTAIRAAVARRRSAAVVCAVQAEVGAEVMGREEKPPCSWESHLLRRPEQEFRRRCKLDFDSAVATADTRH